MIYNIQIGEKTFEVTVDDVNKRPIVAHVNGQEFLVTPVLDTFQTEAYSPKKSDDKAGFLENPPETAGPITAPLPGTIIEIFVKPGDMIETGQVILIIEAMKMKNSIRSTRDGIVDAVLVSAGQTVAHKQALVEFK